MHWCVINVKTGEAWPLPCRSRWLARQCTPRLACLSIFPCIHTFPPLFYSILINMPAGMIAGQPSYPGGPTSVFRHYRAANIVQRLGYRALTGRGLGLTVHQHYGYRIHYELRREFGSRTFERRYPSYSACNRVCVVMVRGYLEGCATAC